MTRATLLALFLLFSARLSAQTADDHHHSSVQDGDPFWPERNSPQLTTPQWIGEPGVEAAVILAIDDLRDNALPKYEAFLRPIFEELKKEEGRAPLSIMACTVKPEDPQLQTWLKEGLSIEVHTLKHPCPLLKDGLATAKENVQGCMDLMAQIPNNQPVAFRTPCCDSVSTPSPRIFPEILCQRTPQGRHLSIDSSVMCLLTPNDPTLPRELVTDAEGRERFRKYFPQSATVKTRSLASFGTYIEDYPYPYRISGSLWEFPCMVPSDWEAFNAHGANRPETVADWKAALDAVVLKKGVFTFIFHPHGWIQPEQLVEFIRYTREKYGKRVKFVNFREAQARLQKNAPAGDSASAQTKPLAYELPDGVHLQDAQGRDNGVRLVDLNGDGYDDLVFSNSERYGVYLFNPVEKKNVDWKLGWTFVMREGKAGDANAIPPIVRADGSNNGVWFKHGAMWVANEETANLPDKILRIPYQELLKQPGPAPRSPEESLKALHVKKGFKAELVANEPLVQDPVWIDWDARGRMWVVEMADYPFHEYEGKTYGGRVKILEDTNGDGIYDKATVFLDGLMYPTGLAPWKNGVFIASVPDVFFVEEKDSKPGRRTPVISGFTMGNPQHLVNGFCWGLDGWFYGGNGNSGGKVVEAKSGKEFDLSGRDFRFNPMTGEFQLQAGQTQYGRWRDDFGNWFGCNNSSMGWHYFMEERYLARNPKLAVPALRRPLNNDPDNKRIFPASAPVRRLNWPDAVNTLTSGCNAIPYRDTLFGPEYAHSFFICEPANNLVHREVLEPDGISFRSHRAADERDSEFLASEDNWSRFSMARTGPDGCLYVVDMYRQIIEHPEWIPKQMIAHLDLRAGSDRGRIYRIRPEAAKPRRVPHLEEMSNTQLVDALQSPNGWQRDTAQRLLMERQPHDAGTAQALQKLCAGAQNNPRSDLPAATVVQALWTLDDLHSSITSGNESVAPRAVSRADDPRLRVVALQVLEHAPTADVWKDVARLASDPDLRVRVQAALSVGEMTDPHSTSSTKPVEDESTAADLLRSLAKRDGENPDMLMALLTSAPRHQSALDEAPKAWLAAYKAASKGPVSKAPVQIITNHNPDRDKVVKAYASVAGLKGDPQRGHTLYKNICFACHKLKGEGNEIGPDLGTMAGKPTDQIVESIMDPSRAVEARYLAQTLKLKGGLDVVAMVAEETANSLTLRTALGTEVVLKEDVVSRSSSTKSVMPEGLENLLKPQDVADVIAWIREK